MRVGESRPRAVDVRFVAAVQAADRRGIDRRQIRSDLLHRLSGVVIELAPLAKRPEDGMTLARHFAGLHGQALDGTCEQAPMHYGWPGTMRELRHTIERAATLASHGCLHAIDIVCSTDLGLPAEAPFGPATDPDRERVLHSLARAGWNVGRAAGLLRVGRATIFRRRKGWGLSVAAARESHESRYGIETPGTLRSAKTAAGVPSA